MKILHISHLYFPAIGGMEALTRLIAEEMARAGHESHVFTANARSMDEFHKFDLYYRPYSKEEAIHNVMVRRFNLEPFGAAFYSPKVSQIRGGWRLQNMLGGRSYGYLQAGPILQGFGSAIGRLKPDVMLTIGNFSWTTHAASKARKQYGIPLVLIPSVHVEHPWEYTHLLKDIYSGVDCIVASTTFERDHLIRQGVEAAKIQIVPHAINEKLLEGPKSPRFRQKHQIPPGVPVILYLGRKVKHKGIDVLIKSMPLIWKDHPQAHLILAGRPFGTYESTLNSLLNDIDPKHAGQIINLAAFENDETKDIYDAADIFTMPSNIDSFGLVYLEAWARQLPVVACRNSPQESFIEHGKTGYLVEYGNVESTAQGLKYLIENQDMRKKIGENGQQQLFKENTVNIYGKRIYEIFKRLNNLRIAG